MEIIRLYSKNPLVFVIRCMDCDKHILMEEETTFCPLCYKEIEPQNIRVWDEWSNLTPKEKIKLLANYEQKNPDADDVFDDKRVGVKLKGN